MKPSRLDRTRAARRLPIGAEPMPQGGVDFRVWAPDSRQASLVLEAGPGRGEVVSLDREPGGYFSGRVAEAGPGSLYRYRLDDGELYPDPASRFQPQGPLGPSEVIDPSAFAWTDTDWPGVRLAGQVLYEMHIGTFTPEGSWEAAARELPYLADLGVTCLEIMPVAEFAGDFGWGYDGVALFAPYHLYGRPEAMRSFVDAAHRRGIGAILDVVYHFGAGEANFFAKFAKDYFSDRYENEWGPARNFDGPQSGPVREYVLANVRHWIEEYRLDGFRVDATQAYHDQSDEHILRAIPRAARAAAGRRSLLIVAESEPQEADLVRPVEQGGSGMDAAWNDDFHHAAMVRLTGSAEAYYTDYRGAADEFVASAKFGYLYQGQWYAWQGKPRGIPALDLPAAAFVDFLQNHDQVANSARGQRVHELTSPARFRAMTALMLLGPHTPMLFQGQEYGASTPFLYFADCEGLRSEEVAAGRTKFLTQFPSLATPEIQRILCDPCDIDAFARSKLDLRERARRTELLALHRDLLRIRREDPVIAQQDRDRLHGATFGADALVLRHLGGEHGDRLVLTNFGPDLDLGPIPQPLLAPPRGRRWRLLWSSEAPEYGGLGIPAREFEARWHLKAESTLLLGSLE